MLIPHLNTKRTWHHKSHHRCTIINYIMPHIPIPISAEHHASTPPESQYTNLQSRILIWFSKKGHQSSLLGPLLSEVKPTCRRTRYKKRNWGILKLYNGFITGIFDTIYLKSTAEKPRWWRPMLKATPQHSGTSADWVSHDWVSRSNPAGGSAPPSCLLTLPRWDRGDNVKGKSARTSDLR